jgi:hypothetical protein
MSGRVLGVVGLVGAGLASLVACSYFSPFCPYGVTPFDRQSDVSTDTVIEFQVGEGLPEDLPPLDDTVTFTTASGRRVPFHLQVRPAEGVVRVIPDEPLSPDTDYEVSGIDFYALRTENHWWGPIPGEDRDYTVSRFRTGPQLALLDLFGLGEDGVVVAFSEAVDLDAVEGRVRFGDEATGWVTTEVVGHWEGQAHLVWLLPVDAVDGVYAVSVDAGLVSVAGASLEPLADGLAWTPGSDREAELVQFGGAPYCSNTL